MPLVDWPSGCDDRQQGVDVTQQQLTSQQALGAALAQHQGGYTLCAEVAHVLLRLLHTCAVGCFQCFVIGQQQLGGGGQTALFGPELAGRVRLGVPDDYASSYLTPVLRSFSSRYQGVEIELTCEQSTSLIPKISLGELDLALVSRDKPQRGRLLFQEPLVWVGAPQYEAWRRNPLPLAVYEEGSMARLATLSSLSAQRRAYRIVYHSASLVGQLAAVESGLAVAVCTRCSVPSGLQILQNLPAEFELPALGPMFVAVLRSKASQRSPAVDALYEQMVKTLANSGHRD